MTLNISGEQNADAISVGSAPKSTSATRRQLSDDIAAELLAWNPREFIGMFRRLHHGQLSLIHLNVLTVLESEGPMPMGRLAEALDVSVASTTGIVDRMESRGYVVRRHETNDRRVVLVQATEAGANVFRDIDEHRRQGLQKLLERLTDDELASLLTGHRALRLARAAVKTERAADTALAAGRTGDTEQSHTR